MEIKMLVFRLSQRMCVLRTAVLLVLCSSLSFGQQCTDSIICQTPFLNLTTASVVLTVSSTCGDPNITSYAYPDTQTAATCVLGAHPKELMIDTSPSTFGNLTYQYPILGTYWQSENSIAYVGATVSPEYIVVNFSATYLIYTISAVFASPNPVAGQSSLTDMRPRAMQVQSWSSDINDWVTWRMFADSCNLRYPGALVERFGGPSNGPLATVCMERFFAGDENTISRSGSGLQEVVFSPARDFMGDFDGSLEVQRHFQTSAIRLLFDYPSKDTSPLLSYYAIASIAIDWKCACYGHASVCALGQCDCQHNTMGAHCDQCLPKFNDRPWQMGVVGQNASLAICQDCSCNAYAASCHFDPFAGHGVCDNCTSNTAGDKCQSCAQFFHVNPNWNAAAPYTPCTGIASDPIIPLTYNCFERCIPCNCSSVGTIPSFQLTCDGMSGNCTCKPNVEGRACDVCRDGFWNFGSDSFFGCIACDCEPSGSLNSINYCDHFNGSCICKQNTEGTRCERCKNGYFDLDITKPDGCTLCDCDVGASVSLACPPFGGACTCKSFVAGRTCRDPYPNYFGAALDYLTFEAEFSPSVTPSDVVERYGAGDFNATNTGRGFVSLVSPRSLTMSLIAPFQSLFTLVIRYETPAPWSGVQASVQLHDPTSIGSATSYNCSTGTSFLATAIQQIRADIPPKATAGAAPMGTVCLLPNVLYDLRLDFLSSIPPASRILVDSVVLIPDFSTSNAYLLSNATTKAQMMQCGRAQQSVDVSSVQNLSCPQFGYSIMVDKFSRAYDCVCNLTGSLDTVCNPIGGQCPCKPNVFLRDCSQCKVNSYGFNSGVGCTECKCDPNGSLKPACDENGICSCKTNVIGNKCDVCIPQYWGVFTGNGCQPCVCNMIYSTNMSCMDSGQCNCLPGVGGIQCDRCADGYYQLTSTGCTSCGCSYYGSQTVNCGPSNGLCACKAQTTGTYCDTCMPGYFGLGPWSNDGCMKCFCSGHSNVCSSAFGWYAVVVNTSLDLKDGAIIWTNAWSGADNSGNAVPITNPTLIGLDGTAVRVMTIDNDFNGTLFYFVAPSVYIGDKRSAYGQYLNISMILSFPAPNVTLIPVPTSGDVFIQGNYTSFTLVTSFPVQPTAANYTPYYLRLHESVWYLNSSTSPTRVQATYENMMQVLASVASIKVRATYFRPAVFIVPLNDSTPTLRSSLVSAGLTYASQSAPTSGDQALVNNIEQCVCPPEYQGQFCELCAPGFTRQNLGAGLFSPCVRCFCNNHQIEGTYCVPETGACNCTDNTIGINCELCVDGYFGYPASGRPSSCQACMCPGNVIAGDVNVYASTCNNDGLGGYECDNCTAGANGTRCETCGDGFFGIPTNTTINNGVCTSCLDPTYCNGNAWYNQTCNSITGDCRNCIFSTTGRNCEICKPFFWGSGVYRNCQPCNCNGSIGRTGDCDKATGTCLCKENITSSLGDNCDTCLYGYFNLTHVNGCQTCDCFPAGSTGFACDPVSGKCVCLPQYVGRQCDTCHNGTWNPFVGCVDCACLNGSKSQVCDPKTGQCPCNLGFAGRQCDICEAGKNASLPYIGNLTLGVYPNCVACGACYDTPASTVSQLGVYMESNYTQMMSLWLTSFNNMSYDTIFAQVVLLESNLNTTMVHVNTINTWFPLFQQIKGNFSLISGNLTYYSAAADGDEVIIMVFQISLNNVRSWTGSVQLAPGVSKFPADLAQDLLAVKLAQDSTFNLSSDTYQNFVVRIGIVGNLNGTVNGLRARVSIALQLIQSSQTVRTQAEALLNISSLPLTTNDAHLSDISVGVSAVQGLNANDQSLVSEANYYLDQAVNALQQVTNWSLNTEGILYNQMRDAQNIGASALAAQRSANTSVAIVNSFLNAAAAAKQLISGNVVSLADALRTLANETSILNFIFQISNSVGATSLDDLQARMTTLVAQINSATIPLDKVTSINNLAAQSQQLAAAAQLATQQDLVKAQNAISILNSINNNLTAAQLAQQNAQAGLTNATSTTDNINSIIRMVNQKGNDAVNQANQTNNDISSSLIAMNNLQTTYPTLAQRFKTARSVGELVLQSIDTLASRSATNVNASSILQTTIDAKTLLLGQQQATLQSIQAELNAMQFDLNNLNTAYNLPGTRDEAIQQSRDMNTLTGDLINLSALLDQLQLQINNFPLNSTTCNV